MNPNPIDNDLQKAIEDITNNTNNDPVFGDPVAAPEPINEPMPVPEPMPPTPMGPLPEAGMPPVPETPEMPEMPEPLPAPEAETIQKPIMDFRPNPSSTPLPKPAPVQDIVPPKPDPIAEAISEQETEIEEEDEPESKPVSGEFSDVKESILRDLAPMVDKMDMDPSKKFDLYKDIHEELHDDSVIASAYEVSKKIDDDEKRADALLYLYDSLK